jgi:4-oxalocrotonate tautomerase
MGRDRDMPIVEIHLLEGRNVEQKRKLAKEVTDAICRAVDVKPDAVRIIIVVMPLTNFAVAGELRIDKKP